MSEVVTVQEANRILLRSAEAVRAIFDTSPIPLPAWAGTFADSQVEHGEVACTALTYTYDDEITPNQQGVSGHNRLDVMFHQPEPNCMQPVLLRAVHDSQLIIPRSQQLGYDQAYNDITRFAVYSMAGHTAVGVYIDIVASTVWEPKWQSWQKLRTDMDVENYITDPTAEMVDMYGERALRLTKACLRPWMEVQREVNS